MLRTMMIVVSCLLQYHVCLSSPVSMKQCAAECGNVAGRQTDAGFLFIRCKILAAQSEADKKMKTLRCLLVEGVPPRHGFPDNKVKKMAGYKHKGGQRGTHRAKSLLIFPATPLNRGYRLNLVTKKTQQFHVPYNLGMVCAIVYMRNKSKFLIATTREIVSSPSLDKDAKIVSVKPAKSVYDMKYDEKRSLVFFSEVAKKYTNISRMRADGQSFRRLVKSNRLEYHLAVDSPRGFVYITGSISLIRLNFDGKDSQVLVKKEGTIIRAVTVDPDSGVVYYVHKSLLMKLSENGQRSQICNLRRFGNYYTVSSMEFHLNVLYMNSLLETETITSLELYGEPLLKMHIFSRRTEPESCICLV